MNQQHKQAASGGLSEPAAFFSATPFLIGRGSARPHAMFRILACPAPASGKHDIQSSAFHDGRCYVFHGHSIVQEYSAAGLEREFRITAGELIHPNDAHFHGGALWICDTGDKEHPPAIKKVDTTAWSVAETHDAGREGWRTAAATAGPDTTLYVVAVEARPVKERTRMLVRRYDHAGRSVLSEFLLPLDQYYVQGCTLAGNHLYITTNNGGRSPCSKFLAVNLETSSITDTIVFDDFGESEGLDAVWIDGRLNLVTGKWGDGVFRIVL